MSVLILLFALPTDVHTDQAEPKAMPSSEVKSERGDVAPSWRVPPLLRTGVLVPLARHTRSAPAVFVTGGWRFAHQPTEMFVDVLIGAIMPTDFGGSRRVEGPSYPGSQFEVGGGACIPGTGCRLQAGLGVLQRFTITGNVLQLAPYVQIGGTVRGPGRTTFFLEARVAQHVLGVRNHPYLCDLLSCSDVLVGPGYYKDYWPTEVGANLGVSM